MKQPWVGRAWVWSAWLAMFVVFGVADSAWARIVPDRMYFGVGQRIVVTMEVPEGLAERELTVRLYDGATGAQVGESAAAVGRADLAALLPQVWDEQFPGTRLAQLYADDVAVGAPLVLQAMVTPNHARLVDPRTLEPSEARGARVLFDDERAEQAGESREVTYSGVRAWVDQEVVLETELGDIVFRMRPDAAPNTVVNFLHLVRGGYYTEMDVHRVVPTLRDGRPFMVQFGDLSGTGLGGPGYRVDLEKSGLGHGFGVLSMARGPEPNSNGGQVFVCLSRAGTAFLDGSYTAFAEAVSGGDIIRAMGAVEVEGDRPLEPTRIVRAYTRDGPPIDGRVDALWQLEERAEADAGGVSGADGR